MTHTFKLARRTARFRGLALASLFLVASGCDNLNRLEPSDPTDSPVSAITDDTLDVTTESTGPSFYTGSTAPGIAFGAFDLPNTRLNTTFSGAVRASGPSDILGTLAAARRVGARVVVRLSGSPTYFQNSDGTVNLTKWKARVARFKTVNLGSYISDGTFLGHYMIDEPHDASNWGGKPVPFSTLEAMAKYSKQLWPGLATMVRTTPAWLAKASFRYVYLDAAWTQYSVRFGNISNWISSQAAAARNEGLGLVVGLNWLHGGRTSGRYPMTASQIKTLGTILATNSSACAFYGWRYDGTYFSRSDIKSAMATVAYKAKSRSRKSCKV
jgi:hypothetical protein